MSPGVGPGGTRRLGRARTPQPPSLVGATLAGRYDVLERIGRGGMGEVFRARHRLLDKEVAIKVLRQGLLDSEAAVDRFRLEAQAAAAIHSPHVVTVHDFGIDDEKRAFIVMELLSGESLRRRLEAGPLAPPRAVRIATQVLGALAHAHSRGVVHRDLKPENILLVGEPEQAKLVDFGLAKIIEGTATADAGRLSATGQVLGTPYYMAPEQARGGAVGPWSDLYSVGAVIYEMLTGERPFEAASPIAVLLMHEREPPLPPRRRRPDLVIPEWLEAVVLRALNKAPGGRFGSALEMRQALCRGELVPLEPARRSRRRLAVALVAVLAGGVLAALAIVGLERHRGPRGGSRAPHERAPRLRSGPSAAAGQAPAAPATRPAARGRVTVEVRPVPAAARLYLDGRPAGVGRIRLPLQRSREPRVLLLRAPGYRESRQVLIPDRDRTVVVRLQPIRRRLGPKMELEKNPYRRP